MKVGSLLHCEPDYDQPGDEGVSDAINSDALTDSITSQYGHQLTALVAKVYAALLPHAAKVNLEKWISEVICGEPAAVVVLLLALYPNLKVLYLCGLDQDLWKTERSTPSVWGNVFPSLTRTAMEPATNTLKVFSKLSDFV